MAVTALGDGAFLDLALRYPRVRGRPILLTLPLYLPAILTLIAVPFAPFLPKRSVEAGLGVAIGVAFLMSTLGGVVFLVKWVRATAADRRGAFLTPIVVALVVPTVIDILGEAGLLPCEATAWNVSYGIVPVTLAWALVRGKLATASPSSPRAASCSPASSW